MSLPVGTVGEQQRDAGIVVRPVVVGDSAAVAELTAQLGYDRPLDAIEQWIGSLASRSTEQVAFVACAAKHVSGGAESLSGWIEVSVERRLQTPAVALIGGLVVREEMRGMGVGKRLCEAVEHWACERGLDTVRVTSRSTREDAHRFYLRDGYTIVKTSLVFEKKLEGA